MPDSSIKLADSTSNTATATKSGTSMSCPHAAGAAALYLDNDPTLTPAALKSLMKSQATQGKISNVGSGSPNELLYTNQIVDASDASDTGTDAPTSSPTEAPVDSPTTPPTYLPTVPPMTCRSKGGHCEKKEDCCKKKCDTKKQQCKK